MSIGGISAHAAGIRAFVVVERALVVASGRHRDEMLAVCQDNVGEFLSAKAFFYKEALAGGSEFVLIHRRGLRTEQPRPGKTLTRTPLPAQRPSALMTTGKAAFSIAFSASRFGITDAINRGGGNAVALHELLGENLAALELRSLARRAQDGQTAARKLVSDAEGQRQLRTHNRKVGAQRCGEIGGGRHVLSDRAGRIQRAPQFRRCLAHTRSSRLRRAAQVSRPGRVRGRRFRSREFS